MREGQPRTSARRRGRPTRSVHRAASPARPRALLSRIARRRRIIVEAAASTYWSRGRIARLRVAVALEEREKAAVAPDIAAARDEAIGRRLARDKAALRLIIEHRDELGAIVGLATQRFVRD